MTGAHRSGTTWLGRCLASHPLVRYIQEPFNPDHADRHLDLGLNVFFADMNVSEYRDVVAARLRSAIVTKASSYAWRHVQRRGLDIRSVGRYSKYFYRAALSPDSCERVLIKDPIALLSAGWLHEQFGLKVICVIRHPLAFVGSLRHAGWDFDYIRDLKQQGLIHTRFMNSANGRPYAEQAATCDSGSLSFIERSCLIWNLLYSAVADYREVYTDWAFPVYEELAMDPVAGIRSLCEFSRLPLSEEVDRYVLRYSMSDGALDSPDHSYVQRDASRSLLNWRDRLSDSEASMIVDLTRPLVMKLFSENILQSTYQV